MLVGKTVRESDLARNVPDTPMGGAVRDLGDGKSKIVAAFYKHLGDLRWLPALLL